MKLSKNARQVSKNKHISKEIISIIYNYGSIYYSKKSNYKIFITKKDLDSIPYRLKTKDMIQKTCKTSLIVDLIDETLITIH